MNKILRKIFALILFVCFISTNLCYAKNQKQEKVYDFSDEAQAEYDLRQKIVKMPKGAVLHLKLNDNLTSTTVNNSDLITVQLSKDWTQKNTLIAPEGSIVTGKIIELKKSGKAQKDGKIAINFYEILKPDGTTAEIKTKNLIIKTDRNAFLSGFGMILFCAVFGASIVVTGGTTLALVPVIVGAGGGALLGGLAFLDTDGKEIEISANTEFKIRTSKEFEILKYDI